MGCDWWHACWDKATPVHLINTTAKVTEPKVPLYQMSDHLERIQEETRRFFERELERRAGKRR